MGDPIEKIEIDVVNKIITSVQNFIAIQNVPMHSFLINILCTADLLDNKAATYVR